MFALPTREGWMVSWYTGEVRPKKRKGKVVGEIRYKDCYYHTSKEKVMEKAKEVESLGYEIEMITECIF